MKRLQQRLGDNREIIIAKLGEKDCRKDLDKVEKRLEQRLGNHREKGIAMISKVKITDDARKMLQQR